MPELLERLQRALAERYAIGRELGEGGMATVYLATDLRHDRAVALKVLKPELAAAVGAERFLREIKTTAQLAHPHILPLLDSGDAEGALFYVMPFVEGESLRDRLARERQLPLDDAFQITREVADALGYAHSRGVIHRDVKPENILLESGHAVVADFGIARAVRAAGGSRLTQTGFAVGTPAYMSPEQAAGNQDLDGRADLYALGCVFFEMLSGETPYTGPTPEAILAKKLTEPVPRVSVVRDTVPPGVEAVLARALARVPADRFHTTEEFADALRRASSAEAIAAEARRPQRSRRRRTALVVAGMVILAAAAWFALSVVRGTGGPRIRSLAVLPLENLSRDTAQDYFVLGMYDAMIGALDQIAALRVISRTSAQTYQGTQKSVPQIARELNVDAVVEGSVLHEGDSVRIRVQLIRALPEERNLWGETYVRNTREVLGLHSDVAEAVARHVQVTLTPGEAIQFASARRVNPKTYEAYLRGRYLLDKGTPAANAQAVAYLRGAMENDPADPLAYAGLAVGYITIAHGPAPQIDALPLAREAAERALRLDSTLTETMACLAFLKGYYDWEWAAADRMFRRALELNPSSSDAHYWYAWQLALFDRMDSAVAEHKRAEAVDPLNPFNSAWLGELYTWQGRYDEAMAAAQRALAVDPRHPVGHLIAAEVQLARGRRDDAVAEARKAVEADSEWLWVVGVIAAKAGHGDEARRVTAALVRKPVTPWNAFSLAVVYAALGDKDQAFRWLGYEHPHAWIPWIRVEPWFSNLWDDPRFPPLLEKMHLPPRRTSGSPPTQVALGEGDPR
jgi:serine/threonine-protein kinase